MQRFRLVIFDFNGTLQDDVRIMHRCNELVLRGFALDCPSFEDYHNNMTSDYMDFYRRHGVPEDVTRERIMELVLVALEIVGFPPLFPDSLRVVEEVRDRLGPPALVSGWDHDDLARTLERHAILDHFGLIRGDVVSKAEAFRECAAIAGVDPQNVAVVGDLVHDAEAATAIGATPFVCPRGFHTRSRIEAAQANIPSMRIIETLEALLEHLM